MNLAAKASAGYAMAALLVAISVMAVLLSVALPTWSHTIRREKEEELIFRGKQYARAINLYQRRFANASPPSLDVLIEQRFLRKKFKDPLSPNRDGEFQLLFLQNQQNPGGRGGGAGSAVPFQAPQATSGPIVGVVSKNTGTSIRVYEGKTKYNEWQFLGTEMTAQPGAPQAGGRGARGTGPGAGGMGPGAPNRGRSQGPPPIGPPGTGRP